jgi:hypothetical protein
MIAAVDLLECVWSSCVTAALEIRGVCAGWAWTGRCRGATVTQ